MPVAKITHSPSGFSLEIDGDKVTAPIVSYSVEHDARLRDGLICLRLTIEVDELHYEGLIAELELTRVPHPEPADDPRPED